MMRRLHRMLAVAARAATALTIVVALLLVGLRLIGAQLDVVETGSMAPAIPEGALAISMPVDSADVVVDDVITFVGPTGSLVMHRVVDVFENQGLHRYRTQGDANATADPGLLREAQIERRVAWSANGLGWAARAVQPPVGVIWLIGLPLLLQLGVWFVGRRLEVSDGAEVIDLTASQGVPGDAVEVPVPVTG